MAAPVYSERKWTKSLRVAYDLRVPIITKIAYTFTLLFLLFF
jgi:hypothetical protein